MKSAQDSVRTDEEGVQEVDDDDGVENVGQCCEDIKDAVQVVAAARLKTWEVNHRKAARQDRDQGLARPRLCRRVREVVRGGEAGLSARIEAGVGDTCRWTRRIKIVIKKLREKMENYQNHVFFIEIVQ